MGCKGMGLSLLRDRYVDQARLFIYDHPPKGMIPIEDSVAVTENVS